MPVPQTPTRRSKRFQPTATPSAKEAQKNVVDCKWTSEPIFTRRMNAELDVLPDLQDEVAEEGTDDAPDEMETVFYDAFWMKRKVTMYKKGPSRRTATSKVEEQTYRVGDTVMVETDTLSPIRRPPSIGVIVAMWQTRKKGDEVLADPMTICIRVHWFLRPSELANIREKREHEENEIYYSLASRAIVTPSTILARCAVSGTIKKAVKEKKNTPKHVPFPTTPSKKQRGSPLKKSTRFSPPSDEEVSDSENEEDSSPTSTIMDPDRMFYCRLALDSRRGLYYTFDWEQHHRDALQRTRPPTNDAGPSSKQDIAYIWGQGDTWDVVEEKQEKAKKKAPVIRQKHEVEESEEEDIDDEDYEGGSDERSEVHEDVEMDPEDEDDEDGGEHEKDEDMADGEPRTPSRKRRGRPLSTPHKSKRSKTLAQPTPHSKAALARRKRAAANATTATPRKRKTTFAIRFPQQSLTFQASMAHLPKDSWLRSMQALHVGSRPDSLPCRDTEYSRVLQCVGELLEEGSGGCIYISGVPGTGKTATVHSVVKELKRMAESSEINPFTYVEINGLKIPEPTAAYNLLWEGVSGHDAAKDGHLRLSWKESLKALTRTFTTGNQGPGGHACVVLMDELDQLVTPKQDVIYNFFNWPTLVGSKLVVIAVANTMDLPERVMTGRVRSRLGMTRINFQPYTREQLEKIVEARLTSVKESLIEDEGHASDVVISNDAIRMAAVTVSRITGDARRVLDICRRAVELVLPTKSTVKIPHIKEVVQTLQNSPTAAFLRDLSFHERVMLASLIKCVKREGVEEVKLSEVLHQHITYMNVLTEDDEPNRRPTPNELNMVLDSLSASHAILVEEGVAIARKGDEARRVMLRVEQAEVERVLGDVGGPRWKNIFG
ncbi:P-loop containing nucleoside triphosphate hydrolase protein [Agrocybe pediades]|nr:P-loop containing nucleoside triphosphate hydrolase protein [Agrocybe pediades]